MKAELKIIDNDGVEVYTQVKEFEIFNGYPFTVEDVNLELRPYNDGEVFAVGWGVVLNKVKTT